MNWDVIKGNWKQFTGQMRSKWGKLTDDDLTTVAGKKDEFLGKLQERYGYSKGQAERELDEWDREQNRTSRAAALTNSEQLASFVPKYNIARLIYDVRLTSLL